MFSCWVRMSSCNLMYYIVYSFRMEWIQRSAFDLLIFFHMKSYLQSSWTTACHVLIRHDGNIQRSARKHIAHCWEWSSATAASSEQNTEKHSTTISKSNAKVVNNIVNNVVRFICALFVIHFHRLTFSIMAILFNHLAAWIRNRMQSKCLIDIDFNRTRLTLCLNESVSIVQFVYTIFKQEEESGMSGTSFAHRISGCFANVIKANAIKWTDRKQRH